MYLAIAFSSGELADGTVELVEFYFPDSHQNVLRMIGLQNRPRVSSGGSGRRESVNRGSRRASDVVNSGLIFADESGHLLPHEEPIEREHSSSSLNGMADFGTDFRTTSHDLSQGLIMS